MPYAELKYHPENPIPLLGNNDIERYFNVESLYMAPKSYAIYEDTKNCRDRAAFVISKNSACKNFDPIVPFLALNYFDRCIDLTSNSLHEVEVIAISCLVIAWKMRDLTFTTSSFLSERPELEDITMERLMIMEILILKKLNWHLRPVTAFCFVPYIAPKFETTCSISDESIKEIIIYAQYDTRITQFRPSIIAASAFLAAADFLYSNQLIHLFFEITSEKFFKESKDEIEACMEGMIRGCHDLKLTIESKVSEGESEPKLGVQAGQASGKICAGGEASALASASASASASPELDVPRTSCDNWPYSDRKGKQKVEDSFVPVVVPTEEEEEESEDEMEFRLIHRWRNSVVVPDKEVEIEIPRVEHGASPAEEEELEGLEENESQPCLSSCSCRVQ